jgi:hypothetical protein
MLKLFASEAENTLWTHLWWCSCMLLHDLLFRYQNNSVFYLCNSFSMQPLKFSGSMLKWGFIPTLNSFVDFYVAFMFYLISCSFLVELKLSVLICFTGWSYKYNCFGYICLTFFLISASVLYFQSLSGMHAKLQCCIMRIMEWI